MMNGAYAEDTEYDLLCVIPCYVARCLQYLSSFVTNFNNKNVSRNKILISKILTGGCRKLTMH